MYPNEFQTVFFFNLYLNSANYYYIFCNDLIKSIGQFYKDDILLTLKIYAGTFRRKRSFADGRFAQ